MKDHIPQTKKDKRATTRGNRDNTNSQGQQAEQTAEQFLRRQGLRYCSRNYRCKVGEIDLVMEDGDILVFVEVRLRSNRHFGMGAESVTWHKQQKIIRASQHYLLRCGLLDKRPCRYDVVALCAPDSDTDIQWLPNAFAAY